MTIASSRSLPSGWRSSTAWAPATPFWRRSRTVFFGGSSWKAPSGARTGQGPMSPARSPAQKQCPISRTRTRRLARGRCLRRRAEAQLLQHAELVLHRPVLDDLAVFDPGDVDGLPCRLLAARRHSGKFALHRAGGRSTLHHQVAFGDLKINGDLVIWKGAT